MRRIAMTRMAKMLASLGMVALLSASLAAQTTGASRFDAAIRSRAAQQLSSKQQFRNVKAAVEDGIVTLTGSVDLYQQRLDAAHQIRKVHEVQGVRNLIAVSSEAVSDAQLKSELNRKLHFDRIGYDNLFNYVTASVKNGNVTLTGQTMLGVDRDSAFALAAGTPGVKELDNNITLAPVSFSDDSIREGAVRAIYHDSELSRYGADPALPIRIVVDNGKLILDGTVETQMDKNIAGIRAAQVFGAFSVQNNLRVDSKS